METPPGARCSPWLWGARARHGLCPQYTRAATKREDYLDTKHARLADQIQIARAPACGLWHNVNHQREDSLARGLTLTCHLGTGSFCLLPSNSVEIGLRGVCLPWQFAARDGWIFLASIPG